MNTYEDQGLPIYFGNGWHYTMTDPTRWADAPRESFWWDSCLTVHPHAVPGSHSISNEMLNAIVGLAQAGRQGVPLDLILAAWAFAHEIRLDAFSAGGKPRMRLDDHHLSIVFAEPARQATAEIINFPKRKRRRLAA